MNEIFQYNILPNELAKHLEDLQFISSIKTGYKVNLTNRNFVDTNSYTNALIRKFYGESRNNLITFINNLIVNTVELLNKYSKTNWEKMLFESLAKARNGIFNLTETYSEDPGFISKVNVCINKLDMILNQENVIKKETENIQ